MDFDSKFIKQMTSYNNNVIRRFLVHQFIPIKLKTVSTLFCATLVARS